MTVVSRARGRPRAFDRDAALRKAMHVFWKHGFEGTSMMHLVEAMGIVSPSIYAAFGSKEDLFREAVALYVRSDGGSTRRALTEQADIRVAVRTMLHESIKTFGAFDEPRGCLIVLGVQHLGNTTEPVRAFLRSQRQQIRDQLSARFRQALEDGELATNADPETLTTCFMAFLNGVSIEAVDGVDEPALLKAADILLERLVPKA